uniref:Uncharacterized protein n=1 Tax=Amphora coffeiformis TaxID=265554 RepID=A0A7S3L8M6_9STRA
MNKTKIGTTMVRSAHRSPFINDINVRISQHPDASGTKTSRRWRTPCQSSSSQRKDVQAVAKDTVRVGQNGHDAAEPTFTLALTSTKELEVVVLKEFGAWIWWAGNHTDGL